ncbi:hypothetical protein [Microbulbifer sp. Q7]|uniref:hypothetical protein n=1 Tax=Microbulbifer sp. Q7 TaxID=1785091 RepID=UPI00128FCCA4|nr:hypothetical protein [Microbulbifer sp. Q7]
MNEIYKAPKSELTDKEIQSDSVSNKPKKKIWYQVFGLLALVTFSGVLIPSINGEQIRPESAISTPFWIGVFFAALWRYREKSGMLGFFLGVLAGILALTATVFFAGFLHR